NLSFPVIWAEGARLTLPGTFGDPQLINPYDGYTAQDVYLQATPPNSWQAGSMDAPDDGAGGRTDVDVSTIDWGDNLEAKSWPLGQNSQLRVETVLYRDLAEGTAFEPMDAFAMLDVDPNPDDRVELWGTTGAVSASPQATVYSQCARLTIQRLSVDREDPAVEQLTWDAAAGKWTGDGLVNPVPSLMTSMSSEVNQAGKVIFGHNWKLTGLSDGHYRITYYLDPACADLNTFITDATQVAVSDVEGEEPTAKAEPESDGGIAGIDGANNLSYIDVQLGDPQYDPYVAPPPPPTTTPPPPTTTPPANTPSGTQTQTRERTRTRARLTLHHRVRSRQRSRITGRLLARQRVRFYGSVLPRHDGQMVRIQKVTRKRVDGKTKVYRTTIARVRLRRATNTRSRYDITLRNVRSGNYRVYLAGDEEHVPTATQTFRVAVR
ncbi:MAG: hypothetical protein ACLGI5_00435, partial [Thermoleophilia bacterium]